MRLLLTILAISIMCPAFGQRKKKDGDEEGFMPEYVEGVMYSLPQTGIRIHIEATKTDFTPGPYARYAEQLLGITDVKTQATASWVMDEVSFEPFSEPDPAQAYKALGDVASLISLTPDGCLAGINYFVDVETKIKAVTNPVSYTGGQPAFQFTNLSDMAFFVAGDSTNGFRPTRLTLEQKAAQAATRILECRRMRFETATGYLDVLPPDGKAYDESLKQLSKLEKEYLTLFTGVSKTEAYHFSFDYIPDPATNKGEVIFRFSDEKGVLEKSDLTGKPVMIEVANEAGLTTNYGRLKKSDNPDAGASGVYYRQPGMAEVKLIYELKAIATTRMPVAQFGVVAPVPELYFDGNYSLEFYTETGAIKNIILK